MDELKAAVDSLAAGGFTNHADAFAKANALFDPNSTNAKVMVMFTDGKTTAMCNTRNFKARVFAHNIDSDFYCCNNMTFRHATSL